MKANVDYNEVLKYPELDLSHMTLEYMHINKLKNVSTPLFRNREVRRFLDETFDFLDHTSPDRQLKKVGEPSAHPITLAQMVKFRTEEWLMTTNKPIYKNGKPTMYESWFGASEHQEEESVLEIDPGAVKLWEAFNEHLGSLALFIFAYKDYLITNNWEYFYYIDIEEWKKPTLGEKAIIAALGQVMPGFGLMLKFDPDEKEQVRRFEEKYYQLKDNLYMNPLAELAAKQKQLDPY
ncbi:hypothetical protein C2I27_03365 [Priestia megaterium]|uniref:hypothetical protein n=1 Tax=Priestia megaterium TaxID=1404 RepID=UPI000D518E27|nr:hypothetical protein [Priestia megaterium]PVC74937.1 hypothetical protein C2I27_03365 [Priestia megaterium]